MKNESNSFKNISKRTYRSEDLETVHVKVLKFKELAIVLIEDAFIFTPVRPVQNFFFFFLSSSPQINNKIPKANSLAYLGT